MPRFKTLGGRFELGSITNDAALDRAFRLAHSIYRFRASEREIALDILRESLRGVEVRLVGQDEADRHRPLRPSKVRWGAAQWLQLLIYYNSERHETRQEAAGGGSLDEEDFVIRYIKHLILTTCRRNSFHLSLGLSRLLYDYSASEATAIYDFVFQDPDSSTCKADAYYRARKNRLVDELHKRFRNFVRITQGARGQRRFLADEEQTRYASLAAQYLSRFTPWETDCELPEQFQPWTPIQPLQTGQLSQMHALIHPPCFSRITGALRLPPPDRRLALPKIFLAGRHDGEREPPDETDSHPPGLTREEAASLRAGLSEDRERRRRFVPRTLSILADGVELAHVELNRTARARFEADAETILFELIGRDEQGEQLLATHLVTEDEDDAAQGSPRTYSNVLEGGQKISLTTMFVKGEAEGTARISVELTYRETSLAGVLALWLRRLKEGIGQRPHGLTAAPGLRLAVVIAALAVVGLLLYFALKGTQPEPPQVAELRPPVSMVNLSTPPNPGLSPSNVTSPTPTPSGARQGRPTVPGKTTPPQAKPGPRGTTREQSEEAIKSLAGVQRIFVGAFGEDAFSRAVRQNLIERLRADGGFVVSQAPDEADTALSGSARLRRKRQDDSGREVLEGELTTEMLNVSGEVIWRGGTYRGTAEQIADRLTRELLDAVRRARGRE